MSNFASRVRTFLLAALLCPVGAGTGWSSIVIAPTFDEMVAQAETIFFGQVVDQYSDWDGSREGRVIVSFVTFRVIETFKGRTATQIKLEFLGGTVGDVTMGVGGVPQFKIGDRDILFVNTADRPVSPIVGVMYGRFRMVRDDATGQDMVRRHDGIAIRSLADISPSSARTAALFGSELSLGDFRSEIARRVAALRSQP